MAFLNLKICMNLNYYKMSINKFQSKKLSEINENWFSHSITYQTNRCPDIG